MGVNYVANFKTKYSKDLAATYGLDYPIGEVQELDNGFVWNNHYYANEDELNKDYYIQVHLGKSSFGWTFALCIYDELAINSYEDWKKIFDKGVHTINGIKDELKLFNILDEDGNEVTTKEMIKIISKRSHPEHDKYSEEYLFENAVVENVNKLQKAIGNPEYNSYQELLIANKATAGINGLWRHMESPYIKLVLGKTYDLVISGNDRSKCIIFS